MKKTQNLPLEEIPRLFGDDIATEDINHIQADESKLDYAHEHHEATAERAV